MKTVLFLVITLVIASAQVFDWSGEWEVWDLIPKEDDVEKSECCVPQGVKIAQNACNPYLLDLKFNFSEPCEECPLLNGTVEIHELVINGQFIDLKKQSKLYGSYALYFPNNDTIVLDPGYVGNCKYILGNEDKSIITNTSDANAAFAWDGDWDIYEIYPAIPHKACCKPTMPLKITSDEYTGTIAFDLTFEDEECPDSMIGVVTHVNVSAFGGAFVTDHARGFYLQNETLLVECSGCVALLDKEDADIEMINIFPRVW